MTSERAGRAARLLVGPLTSIAWYPTMLALVWALRIVNDREVDPAAVPRSLLVIAALSIGVTLVVRLLVRSTPHAGAVATFIVLLPLMATTPATVALFSVAATLVLVEYRMELRGSLRLPWPRIHESLTVIGVILLVVEGGGYGAEIAGRPAVSFDPSWAALSPSSATGRPDMYIVIADGHGRSDVLQEAFSYDTSPFEAELEHLGFDISTASRANYVSTDQSFASFFSGSHLAQLGMDMRRPPDPAFLSAALVQSPAIALLQRLGYDVQVETSGFDHVAEQRLGRDIGTGQLTELEVALLQSTLMQAVAGHAIEEIRLDQVRDRTAATLRGLEEAGRQPARTPRAVIAHLPVPHPPFVFDGECRPLPLTRFTYQGIDPAGPDVPAVARLAGEQNRCVDRLLTSTLEALVAADPTAVVLLMSDHGPDVRFNWHAPGEPGLHDRIACLFAARTPGHDSLFPDDITLVNVLPTLFNAYFGTRLPIRGNDAYVGRPEEGGVLVAVADP